VSVAAAAGTAVTLGSTSDPGGPIERRGLDMHTRTRRITALAALGGLIGLIGLVGCQPRPGDGTDLAVRFARSPAEVRQGDTINVHGAVANEGDVAVGEVVVRAASTSGLDLTLFGPGFESCTAGAGGFTCVLPAGDVLEPDEVEPLVLTITASAVGDQEFAALASGDGDEQRPDPHPNGDHRTLQVTAAVPSTTALTGSLDVDVVEAPAPVAGVPFDLVSRFTVAGGIVDDLVVTQVLPPGVHVAGRTYVAFEGWDEGGEPLDIGSTCTTVGRVASCRFEDPISSTFTYDSFWMRTQVVVDAPGDHVLGLTMTATDPTGGGPTPFETTTTISVLPADWDAAGS
jgi:hypothetical protein